MVVRLAMALISVCWAHVVNFFLTGILSGDFAALSSHGAEEDVTLGCQGWMIQLLEGLQWCWSSYLWVSSSMYWCRDLRCSISNN